ncbi:MAG: phosphoribosylamine--glycine ligase, partial [Bdellovibrionales bacterium]|nr:phosphoribosylamine--glycine ligase [Bdellovibrionales bacterium]
RAEAQDVIESHFAKGSDGQGVLLEQFLAGREASFIVMTDGERILPFPASNDYKRIFDNDEGPNTGGMGTVSPTAHLSPQLESRIVDEVIRPVLQELKRRDIPFVGFLYAGLMISPSNEVQVIEFNARLGDPETQVILRRWQGNLARTLYGLASGGELPPQEHSEDKAAVCIVLASHGYPQSSRKGDVISGVAEAESLGNVVVFHAGTAEQEGKLVTAGGRVLGVTAIGETVQEARLKAYEAVERITFDGLQYRSDIACNQE